MLGIDSSRRRRDHRARAGRKFANAKYLSTTTTTAAATR
jgi:hypothetical protein